MATLSLWGRPQPADVEGSNELGPVLWKEALDAASQELAVRARPALRAHLALLLLASWAASITPRGGRADWLRALPAAVALLTSGLARERLARRADGSARWWTHFTLLTVANALVWALLGAAVTLEQGVAAGPLGTCLIIAGIVAASTTSLAPDLRLSRLYAVIILAPPCAAFLAQGAAGLPVAVALATYLAFLMFQVRTSSGTYWSGVVAGVAVRAQGRALRASREEARAARESREALIGELTSFHADAQRDYAVASRIFQGIVERSFTDLRSVVMTMSPLEQFNGDILMLARSDGRLRWFLGDFTGHGLSAAVGAIPVADVFFATAQRGLPLELVLRETNRKVRQNLPRGIFLSAFLGELDPRTGRLAYWNGGLPAALVLGPDGRVRERLESTNTPLGLLPDADFRDELAIATIARDDGVFTYSDGVVEAADPSEELFGDARLEAALAAGGAGEPFRSPRVREALAAHRGGAAASDDVTYLEIRNDEDLIVDLAPRPGEADGAVAAAASARSLALHLDAIAIRRGDALDEVERFLGGLIPDAREAATALNVVAELYVNAVDHGILRLDSHFKDGPEGFERYFQSRELALACLDAGTITVRVTVAERGPAGRRVAIRVEDSGPGFAAKAEHAGDHAPFGRGLMMVRAACTRLVWLDGGRAVEAELDLAGSIARATTDATA